MANSKVGQYRFETTMLGWTSPTRNHDFGLWMQPTTNPAPGTSPDDIDIQLLGGGTKTLQEVANQLLSFVKQCFSTTISVNNFNLWRYATEYSRDFVSAGIATYATVGAGSISTASETVLTFRGANGGVAKVVLLESNLGGDAQSNLTPNPTGLAYQKLAAYLMSADSPMIALDNSFVIAPLKVSSGQNESIWRKIHRA
jgi:hypothetical protein